MILVSAIPQPTAAAPSLGLSAFTVSSQPPSAPAFSFGTPAVTSTSPSTFGGLQGFGTDPTAAGNSSAPSLSGSSQTVQNASIVPNPAATRAFNFG